jgi:glycosyltransferase involved in cell wall biosynthesis
MEILSISDIFVLPSLGEGLPLVLLEAMISECACIVTDIGVPIKDEITGLLVPPKDPISLGKAIQRLIHDETLRAFLAKNAKKEAKAKYSWKKASKKHRDIYKSLLS